MELRRLALDAWLQAKPPAKLDAVKALARSTVGTEVNPQALLTCPNEAPGRPAAPRLVDPRSVPQRAMSSPEGRARLMHAVAHIEFNAINLALDACWRFEGLPRDYYLEWAQVAVEEAQHFALVESHLQRLGHRYGDFDAHDGLWQMAQVTRHDVLSRMALVPRLLEARGLDVTPGMQQRLAQAGDAQAVAVLAVILRDEVGHVAVGNRWYHHLCVLRGMDPIETMQALMREHRAPKIKEPLNREARLRAGFSSEELERIRANAS